jgi:hypothetical protein
MWAPVNAAHKDTAEARKTIAEVEAIMRNITGFEGHTVFIPAAAPAGMSLPTGKQKLKTMRGMWNISRMNSAQLAQADEKLVRMHDSIPAQLQKDIEEKKILTALTATDATLRGYVKAISALPNPVEVADQAYMLLTLALKHNRPTIANAIFEAIELPREPLALVAACTFALPEETASLLAHIDPRIPCNGKTILEHAQSSLHRKSIEDALLTLKKIGATVTTHKKEFGSLNSSLDRFRQIDNLIQKRCKQLSHDEALVAHEANAKKAAQRKAKRLAAEATRHDAHELRRAQVALIAEQQREKAESIAMSQAEKEDLIAREVQRKVALRNQERLAAATKAEQERQELLAVIEQGERERAIKLVADAEQRERERLKKAAIRLSQEYRSFTDILADAEADPTIACIDTGITAPEAHRAIETGDTVRLHEYTRQQAVIKSKKRTAALAVPRSIGSTVVR